MAELPMLPLGSRTFWARGRQFTHHFVQSAKVACIVPCTARGSFLLIEQYRPALDRKIIEFPAGKCEPGEEPLQAARRELEEETGVRAGRFTHLLVFCPVPGYSTEEIHVFLAEELSQGHTGFDDSEDIATQEWTAGDIEDAIDAGRIVDGKTILAFWAWQRRNARRGAGAAGR